LLQRCRAAGVLKHAAQTEFFLLTRCSQADCGPDDDPEAAGERGGEADDGENGESLVPSPDIRPLIREPLAAVSPAGLMRYCAKIPTMSIPVTPPTPWVAVTPKASSKRLIFLACMPAK
jgi:hypothetical protein